MTSSRVTVVGVFHSPAEAKQAIQRLKAEGYTEDQISLITRHQDLLDVPFEESATESRVKEDAAIGATAGLGAGALWGIAIAAGLLPAIGPAIAGGALMGIIATAAATAAAGSLVGALIGLGVPEKEAEYYHSEFEQGRTVVTVQCDPNSSLRAREIFDDFNAYDYQRREFEYAWNPEAAQRPNLYGELVARQEATDLDQAMLMPYQRREPALGGGTKQGTPDVVDITSVKDELAPADRKDSTPPQIDVEDHASSEH